MAAKFLYDMVDFLQLHIQHLVKLILDQVRDTGGDMLPGGGGELVWMGACEVDGGWV